LVASIEARTEENDIALARLRIDVRRAVKDILAVLPGAQTVEDQEALELG